MPGLIDCLVERPEGFDLFQALHLLERAAPVRRPLGTSVGLDESARLSAPVSLAFASSAIQSAHASDRPGPPLTLTSPLMALAGAQGPLPVAYTELLLEGVRRRNLAGPAFLDIFQQRLLAFLYRGRRKHHVALDAGPLKDAPLMRAIDAVSGLGRGEGARAPRGQAAWLRHAGLQGGAPRSMASLIALLRDRLGLAFEGQSLVGGWHRLAREDRAYLEPSAPGLGRGAALGRRAWDPAAGIALRLKCLTPERLEPLLPGGSHHSLLAWLVGRHLQQDLSVQLQVNLQAVPAVRLGCRAPGPAGLPPRLGLTVWLSGPTRACGLSGPRAQGLRLPLSMQG